MDGFPVGEFSDRVAVYLFPFDFHLWRGWGLDEMQNEKRIFPARANQIPPTFRAPAFTRWEAIARMIRGE